MTGMNPYEAPSHHDEQPPHTHLTGWALATDSLKLLVIGLAASIVVVPILIVFVAVLAGFLQALGVPMP
jgi:hypothetical protein